MHMRKVVTRIVAPATLASALLILASGWEQAASKPIKQGTVCAQGLRACHANCARYPLGPFRTSCESRCSSGYDKCMKPGGAGKVDTGGTGKPPKAGSSTSPGGGVATDPKSPPKATGTRAPVVGGVFSQPTTTGSGGSGPILRSGGGKR